MLQLKLTKHVPARVCDQLPDVIAGFAINTPLRLAHFLAQCAHESAHFTAVAENLRYGPKGLLKIFPKYFPNEAKALDYAKQPERIANLVYANRMGNGGPETGDGYRYRGRGYIQLTGKVNYAAFDKVVSDDILAHPELVATKYPLLSAAWFWDTRKLNALADKGADDAAVTLVTKRVNGGTNGLAERIQLFQKYYALLKV